MQKHNIDFSKTQQFSSLFLDYIQQKERILNFQNYSPDLGGIATAFKNRTFSLEKRKVLVAALQNQYQNLDTSPLTQANIQSLLLESTFTVTCGHQLNLFTGPLYFIYKILSTIKLAERLKVEFPNHNFVPIYWMASEDHDFAEINHFTLFGKTYTWEHNAKGAVGKLSCDSLLELLATLPEEIQPFATFYKTSKSLAEATSKLVNHLFANYGLIILNPDVRPLRAQFINCFIKELQERKSIELLQNQTRALETLGYKAQVSGRDINLMYADEGIRERIVYEAGKYQVLNTGLSFTPEEITSLVQSQPEKFSTNVVLRPVYQEVILPNLAFVGGPAEVTYWLQLKEVFAYFEETMPVILPRNFAMILTSSQVQKLAKSGLTIEDILLNDNELRQLIASKDLILDYTKEEQVLQELGESLQSKALQVDKSLIATVAAEQAKLQKMLEDLQKRFQKALEKRNIDTIAQVVNIKQKLYPEGNPQERVDNFLNYYINDPQFISHLYENFDPLVFMYYMLVK